MNMLFAVLLFIFCIGFAGFMSYRDQKDERASKKTILKENLGTYYHLKSISKWLTIIAVVILVLVLILAFFAGRNVIVTLLLIDSIIFIITGNIIAHYKLLRR